VRILSLAEVEILGFRARGGTTSEEPAVAQACQAFSDRRSGNGSWSVRSLYDADILLRHGKVVEGPGRRKAADSGAASTR
jgi:hypothetical protein